MIAPKISVIMGTYNHEPFVAKAVGSVLSQAFEDYELLIADDGSADGTPEQLERFTDSRIRFWRHDRNRGACVVLNELIARARGMYIAILNSDDFWPSDKLGYQYDFLEHIRGCAAIFGRVAFVDHADNSIAKGDLPFGTVFDQPNRSSAQWLRRFFQQGNCLCHPTVLIRRECYDEIGRYDNRYRQLPDFDMWIRLVKRFQIHVSDRDLISFRILPGQNTSSPTLVNSIRGMNENMLIANGFFHDLTSGQLREGFGDLLVNKEMETSEHVEIEKALLCLSGSEALRDVYRLVALSKLYGLLGRNASRGILASEYGIDDIWFQQRMAEVDTLTPIQSLLASGQTAIGVLENRIRALESERDVLLNSMSWRLTAPLRNIRHAGGRLQRSWLCCAMK